MSWIRTEMCCNKCHYSNTVAWQIPDGLVTVYPTYQDYAIADCQKNGDRFSITFDCKQCGVSVTKDFTKEEFDKIAFEYIK